MRITRHNATVVCDGAQLRPGRRGLLAGSATKPDTTASGSAVTTVTYMNFSRPTEGTKRTSMPSGPASKRTTRISKVKIETVPYDGYFTKRRRPWQVALPPTRSS